MTKSLLFLLILLFFTGPAAHSQSPSGPLTMQRVIASYIEHNLELQAARYRLERTRADQIAAKLRPNPSLSLTAENLRLTGPLIAGGLYEFGAAYSETFELGGKRDARIRVADATVSAAKARFGDAMRQGIAEVKRLFLQAVLARRSIEVARENQQTFQGLVQLNLTRFQEGAIPEADLIKVRLERIKFDSAVRQAELSFKQAMIRLAENLEDPGVTKQDVAAEFDLRLIRPDVEILRQMALRERPDVQAAEREVEASRERLILEQTRAGRTSRRSSDTSDWPPITRSWAGFPSL